MVLILILAAVLFVFSPAFTAEAPPTQAQVDAKSSERELALEKALMDSQKLVLQQQFEAVTLRGAVIEKELAQRKAVADKIKKPDKK